MQFPKTHKILEDELNLLYDDLIAEHKRLKMPATGNWMKTLAVNIVTTTGQMMGEIVGSHYTRQLDFGRKPGKMPPVKAIERWIEAKGIRALKAKMTNRQLAFAIAVKIKKEGTRYYKQGGTTLVRGVVTMKRIEDILSKVTLSLQDELFEMFSDKLTELSQA